MSNEQFLQSWEQEKQRLAALGHEWSLADAYHFSMLVYGKVPESVISSEARNAVAA